MHRVFDVFSRRTEKKKLLKITRALRDTGSITGLARYAEEADAIDRMMSSGQFELPEAMARDIVIALDLSAVCRPPGADFDPQLADLGSEYAKLFCRTYGTPVYPD